MSRVPFPARRKASALGATVTSAVLAIVAVIQPGVPRADVELNDGGVWVTNAKLRLVAHLNYPSRTLDGGLRAPSESFDVSQAGADVLVHDRAGSQVLGVDVSLVEAGTPLALKGLQVVQGGSRVAIVDRARGAVWGLPASGLTGFSPDASAPLIDHAVEPLVTLGVDGSIHALSKDGTLGSVPVLGEGWGAVVTRRVEGLSWGAGVLLSAVGPDPVVVDRSNALVWSPAGAQSVPAAKDAVLQQPGPASPSVALATADQLVNVPLGKGDPITIPSGGQGRGVAVAPAVVAGCVYAAWTGSGRYVRDCPDQGDDVSLAVDTLRAKTDVTFRSNRDVVVLNDTANGDVFVVSKDVLLVNNWQDVLAQVESKDTKEDKATETTQERAAPERTNDNHKPTAGKDDFGVRAGRASVLPVLQNDTDIDGDILTAEAVTAPTIGTLSRVRAGGALALTVPPEATGTTRFTYRANDGRGGTDDAVVTVTVHPPGSNFGPKQVNLRATIAVEQGGEVSYNVSPDWIDPEGDAIFLGKATAPEGLSVKTREDGLVTVRDLGTGQPGRKDVTITMTDGAASTDGVLHVDVRSRGAAPPIANADHVRVIKGREALVSPLANDTDANGDALRLAKVAEAPAGARIVPDFQAGTFRFTSDVVGTVYVGYVVSDGPSAADGVVRLDVVDVAADPPVAEDDLALLPAGGRVIADVLTNDFDPAGGVLVVQSISVPHDSNINVQVLDRSILRITAPAGLKTEARFSYTVSNGAAQASAQVTVVPLAPIATDVPPIADDDRAEVRVGDVVTVHVLDNDRSPSGLSLTVDPSVQTSATPGQGEAFVSQDTVRFKAGQEPGTVRLVYTVRDARDNYDSAEVVITVHALEGTNNSPPRPMPLIGRVLAGATVRIPVPLDGIDPDGDSVTLLGVDRAPDKGTIAVRSTWLEYAAPADAVGTDTFTYTVMDRFGARATASVQVGIAPPAPVNQAPIAVADAIIARPDRLLAVPVLLNDVDPDGDQLSLVEQSVVGVGAAAGVRAGTSGPRVSLTTPHDTGTYVFSYAVSDGHGGVSKGQLTVDVRPDTPLQVPIARDDVVPSQDIAGKQEISVDVLANDEDPDGSADALTVAVAAEGVRVKGGSVTVPLKPERQVIVYTVTDVDKLDGKAVIAVPGTADRLPTLRPEKIPAKVTAGQTLTISLAEYVSVRDGRSPQLTFENRVKAGPGGDGSSVIKDATTLVFTPHVEYAGASSLTFEVTDGASADDPAGLDAVLTLPIEVISSGKHLPVLSPAEVTAAAGEAPTRVDLTSMVKDKDEGDLQRLTFTIGSAPAQFTARLDGTMLEVSTPAETKPGTAGVLDVTVTDGSTNPVSGQLPLKTVSSTRPKMTVTEAVITDANAGTPVSVDLTRYVTNPFAAEGKPIALVGEPKVAIGAGQVSASSTTVTVTPGADFHGQLTVTYLVADATADPTRRAEGRISLTVRAVPEPPTGVSAQTHASRSVTVSWTAGANNGAEISKFTVSWASSGGNGHKDCGRVTTCEITTLTNNVHYTFTVVATNVVGDSKPSAASNDVRPDVRPSQPSAPTTVFGDKEIKVSWIKPATEGSPVTGYTLEISPGSGGATQMPITGGDVTSYTWKGLANGTAYTFRVQAHSSAEEPSEWSPYSSPEIPAGAPLGLTAPRVVKNPVSTLPPSGTISWAAPSGNGDDNLIYEVRRTGTTVVVYTGSGTSTGVTMTVDTTDQTFEFRAKNKAGWSGWSPASNPVRAFQVPGAVTNLVATPTGADNQVRVTFNPAPGNGARPEEIGYTWSAGGGSGAITSGGTITYGGLNNGGSYAVTITARSTVRGETSAPGPAATSNTVVPFGPPRAPAVSASGGYRSVTLSWSPGSSSNGRAIEGMQINTGGGWENVSLSGSRTVSAGPSQTIVIYARALYGSSGNNLVGSEAYTSGAAWPDSTYGWGRDAAITTSNPGFCSDGCNLVNLTLRQFRPNSNVYCFVPGVNAPNWYATIGVDGNGNWGPSVPAGSPGRPVVDTGVSTDGFGTCTQQ